MVNLMSCPLCKTKNIARLSDRGYAPVVKYQLMPKVFVDALIVTNYFKCISCNVIFQNPRMSDKELQKFYGEGIYRRVINLTDKEKDLDEKLRADVDAKIISQIIGKVKSHLDVGCSRGYLLNKVNASKKYGVDQDVKNIRFSSIRKYPGLKNLSKKTFDLVTLIHTLEHVSDPKKYLKSSIKLLNQGGYLVVEVPTWKSPGGPLRLPHLYHFEPDVLRLILKEFGLKIIQTEFTPHLLLICQKV